MYLGLEQRANPCQVLIGARHCAVEPIAFGEFGSISTCPAVPILVGLQTSRPGSGVAGGAVERGASSSFLLMVPGILALAVCCKLSGTYTNLLWFVPWYLLLLCSEGVASEASGCHRRIQNELSTHGAAQSILYSSPTSDRIATATPA